MLISQINRCFFSFRWLIIAFCRILDRDSTDYFKGKFLVKITLSALCLFATFPVAEAQIQVIAIPVGPAAKSTAVCYQLFIQGLPQNCHTIMVFGNSNHPLIVSSDSAFWQSSAGSHLGSMINPAFFSIDPMLRIDSWVTINQESKMTGAPHLMEVESPQQPWIEPFEMGKEIRIDDLVGGGWFIMPSRNLESRAGRDLIGQFTTAGNLSGKINVKLYNTLTGESFDYYDLIIQVLH